MNQSISSEFTAAEPVLRAIRTTGSTRYQSNRDVPNDVVMAALEAARFGPSGGNRQPVRWIVIRDPQMRQTLAELYLPLWQRDMNMFLTGQMRTGATLGPAITAADHVAELLGLPDDVMCACHVLVGYPTESFAENPNRMPLDQLVFAERYGHPHLNPEQGN